jgi:uroporphyrinogen-III synthase
VTTAGALRLDQLRGFRIGVTSHRRAEDLIAALQRRGAQVLHAPALRMAHNDGDHDRELVEDTRAVIRARPDFVLVTTGYGMRRWLEVADATGLGAALVAVLEDARVLARGPKALGAVRAAGLDEADLSEAETTASLVDQIIDACAPGVQVAVQLHGYVDEVQLDRLRRTGADVSTVQPYRWVQQDSSDRLTKLVDAVCRGDLDAVTFTSAPAVVTVLEMAARQGQLDEFCDRLRTDVVSAVVGPVTAAPLLAHGVAPIQPERFRMGALIRLVCDHLERTQVARLRSTDAELELRGRCVDIRPLPRADQAPGQAGEGRSVLLGPHALALFRALIAKPSVVSRHELVRCLGDGRDEHALEVAVSRLRRTLGVPGLITTVVRRGYRLDAVRVGPSTEPLEGLSAP